jgi:hypothetical protein
VRLLQAHRILIASGMVLCGLYILLHSIRYASTGANGDLLKALCAFLLAVPLGVYLRSLRSH